MTRKERLQGLLAACLCGGSAGQAISYGWLWWAGVCAIVALVTAIVVARGEE